MLAAAGYQPATGVSTFLEKIPGLKALLDL
jgi:hypothetical protein